VNLFCLIGYFLEHIVNDAGVAPFWLKAGEVLARTPTEAKAPLWLAARKVPPIARLRPAQYRTPVKTQGDWRTIGVEI